jgi:hypothetical protein
MTLTWVVTREATKAQRATSELAAGTVAKVVETHESQTKLLDKAIALLSAKSPLEFQAVQAMSLGYTEGERYDPSDEAEIDRMRAFGLVPAEEGDPHGDSSSDDEELEWFRTHGVPGPDF